MAPFIIDSNGDVKEKIKDITNLLANTFAANSSDSNCEAKLTNYKRELEPQISNKTQQAICEDVGEPINSLICMNEITTVLRLCKKTSPGPDGIPSILIKHLPTQGLELLLEIYNYMFRNNIFPDAWKLATIIR